MHDPIAAGRSAATRAIAVQVIVTIAVALLFWLQGAGAAAGAAVGGGSMALGNALGARLALRGLSPAGVALGRLLLGTLGKWLVVMAGLMTALALWQLPPLPVLAGLAASLLAYLLALNLPVVDRTTQGSRRDG